MTIFSQPVPNRKHRRQDESYDLHSKARKRLLPVYIKMTCDGFLLEGRAEGSARLAENAEWRISEEEWLSHAPS